VMRSSAFYLNRNPLFFFNSDSPFKCLNDRIKNLLSYIRKFLRKKIGKNKFYNEQNQVYKSNSQIVLPISIVCVICFTKRFRKWLI
jgi:hypothetical protein